jgi:hypothetical protein
MYSSRRLHELLKTASDATGISENFILFVKNYHGEHESSVAMDVQILDVLQRVVCCCKDHVDKSSRPN